MDKVGLGRLVGIMPLSRYSRGCDGFLTHAETNWTMPTVMKNNILSTFSFATWKKKLSTEFFDAWRMVAREALRQAFDVVVAAAVAAAAAAAVVAVAVAETDSKEETR